MLVLIIFVYLQTLRSVLQSAPSSQQLPPPSTTAATPHRFKLPHPVHKKQSQSSKPLVRKTPPPPRPKPAVEQYAVRDRSERARHRTPILDRIIVDRGDPNGLLRGLDVKALRIRRKKAREIQIPGWRPTEEGGERTAEYRRPTSREKELCEPADDAEDTSDLTYISRHAKERPVDLQLHSYSYSYSSVVLETVKSFLVAVTSLRLLKRRHNLIDWGN